MINETQNHQAQIESMQLFISQLQRENRAICEGLTEKSMAKRVKILREIHNYSQEYVAFNLSITQSAYSKIENAGTMMTYSRLHKILEVLEISLADFLKFDLTQIIKNKNIQI